MDNNPAIDSTVINDNPPLTGAETSASVAGLSAEEQNDPNSISVVVSDPKTPVIVLYGPPSCGKTMTLVRMTRYLQSQGYTIVPDKTFRPSYDENYKEICKDFDQMINSNSAAKSTAKISFMLVKVLKNGNPICQILEAPGEYYFSPEHPNEPYPPYVHKIINSPNRKIWAIMLEPDWNDIVPRNNYVARIRNLKMMMMPRDKVVFVYNKIDLTPFVISGNEVNKSAVIKNAQDLYRSIFVPFENQNPITRFFKKYNCEFVPFMTGNYSETMTGGFAYTEGHPVYARKLWQTLLKLIKG